MKVNKIEDLIKTYSDYPKPGITFFDLNSLFSSAEWNECIATLAKACTTSHPKITHIIGIESRGFVVGSALAYALKVPFTMVRKKGSKYPGALFEESYQLEYGKNSLVLQKDVLNENSKVLIADDLIATGGSIKATRNLVEKSKATVLGYVTVLNLSNLNDLTDIISLKEIT